MAKKTTIFEEKAENEEDRQKDGEKQKEKDLNSINEVDVSIFGKGTIGQDDMLDLNDWYVGEIDDLKNHVLVHGMVKQKKEVFFSGPFLPTSGQIVEAINTD